MCGISGIFFKDKYASLNDIQPMVDVIRHRGPDSDGIFMKDKFAMGMRRLSIIDIGHSNQPIFNEDRSLAIVFNGEIYNYIEIRERLVRKRHTFSTTGDTETIIHLYEDE